MGNSLKAPSSGSLSSHTSLAPKNRRYSQSSAFCHWSDHIKEKKVLTIQLKETGPDQGLFSLSYTDESADNFFVTKTHFVFSGRFQHQRHPDLPTTSSESMFGVGIPVNVRGDVILEDVVMVRKQTLGSTTTSATAHSGPDTAALVPVSKSVTHFFTEKLTCKLMEGEVATQQWVVVQSTAPDCLEKTSEDMKQCVSWLWPSPAEKRNGSYHHMAPPGALDFIGEESISANSPPSIDLRIRFPQLQVWLTPPVLTLNEISGWKLSKA